MGEFNARDLANTAFAFGTMVQANEDLLAALARAVARRVGEFDAQDLTNTTWAFATACQSYEKLFAALGRVAERRVRCCALMSFE